MSQWRLSGAHSMWNGGSKTYATQSLLTALPIHTNWGRLCSRKRTWKRREPDAEPVRGFGDVYGSDMEKKKEEVSAICEREEKRSPRAFRVCFSKWKMVGKKKKSNRATLKQHERQNCIQRPGKITNQCRNNKWAKQIDGNWAVQQVIVLPK